MQGPLRIIFLVTVLLLWILFGIGLVNGAWSAAQWLMLIMGHLACTIIFVSFVYVFNYGYGMALALIGAALLVLLPSVPAALVGAVAIAFGLRMLRFSHARYQSVSYAANFERQRQANSALPLPARLIMWICVSWLMSFELMPLYFVARAAQLTPWVMAGAALMGIGLVAETVADQQKQAAKARNPSGLVSDGLFGVARHPNYLGEIVFQLGLILACLGSVSGWWEVAVAVLAPVYVIILMVHAGLDADRAQASRYGEDPAYRQYRARTGCFLPGL